MTPLDVETSNNQDGNTHLVKYGLDFGGSADLLQREFLPRPSQSTARGYHGDKAALYLSGSAAAM
jgi:hypothetical protein